MRAEALVLCGVSRETPPSLLSSERVLVTLEATQVVPGHPRLHSRGTPRVLPLLKKSPGSPSLSREEGLFPCFVGEGILAYLSHLKKRRSPIELEKNSSSRATILNVNSTGTLTLLLQLKRKADLHVSTRDEA